MLRLIHLVNNKLKKQSQTINKYSSTPCILNVASYLTSTSTKSVYTFQTHICGFHTSDRSIIAASKSNLKRKHNGTLVGQCELDSHADTTVAGGNCCVLHYIGVRV